MNPAQCAERAFQIPGMIRKHSIDLCIGAVNSAPLNCYLKVSNIDRGIATLHAIEPCAGTVMHGEAVSTDVEPLIYAEQKIDKSVGFDSLSSKSPPPQIHWFTCQNLNRKIQVS